MPLRVLIVDDSDGGADAVVKALREGGYEPAFERVDTAETMSAALDRKPWDMVIAAESLPRFSALGALTLLKERALELPVVVVSDAPGEEAVVAAIRAGAHDYVTWDRLRRLDQIILRVLREGEERRERRVGVERAQRERQLQNALLDANVAISSTLDLQTVLDFLLEKVDLVLSNSATTVSLLNKETGLLEPAACRNINEKEWKAAYKASHRPPGNGVPKGMQRDALQGAFPNTHFGPTREKDIFLKYGFASHLEVPLITNDQLLGTVGFYTKKEYQLSKEEIDFLCVLTTQAAIAIQKSRLYEQTNRQAAELQRANRIKSDFLTLISHELRTPLTAIIGYAGIVRDRVLGEINDKQQDALGKLLFRSNNLLAMIDSILQATMFETEEVKVEHLEVNLVDLVGELKLLYRAPLDKDLKLVWDCPARLPVIRTDRAKLMYILQNLINNAVKFTERGFVKIGTRHLPKVQAVRFRVADTGIGIPKKALPDIFEVFRQVDSSERRLYGGMGIGLYIVKKFSDILGGKVEVNSRLGRGSVFTVTVPYQG